MFHISSILYCIFILCIIVTNLALWLQDLNKLTYLLTKAHLNHHLVFLMNVNYAIETTMLLYSHAVCQSAAINTKPAATILNYDYLLQGGYVLVLPGVCLFVCLSDC